MKFAVVVFPGSNCDQDCLHAVKDVLGQKAQFVWHQEPQLGKFDCVVLPGGFSYGDYLRCGAIARFSPIMSSVKEFADRGGLVVGICNGFQILLEAGLLPGAMLRNTTLHFICKHVFIRAENNTSAFTNACKKRQVLNIPVAHNEGNYFIDRKGLADLEKNGQVAFRYCSESGDASKRFCPNGALNNIAGITNRAGNVLGMMPHPERSAEAVLNSKDGLLIFKSIAHWMKKK